MKSSLDRKKLFMCDTTLFCNLPTLLPMITFYDSKISIYLNYTLSHPENDRDVTDCVQEYTLQDASIMRQSLCSFLNE